MAEKKLAKKKITWTKELMQTLFRCNANETKINNIINKRLRNF